MDLTSPLSAEDADIARGLALEAVMANNGGITVYATLDIAHPDTIHNFNTFGRMLLAAYKQGRASVDSEIE